MRLLICGDRNYHQIENIRDLLEVYGPSDTVIHGACRGADHLAGVVAASKGIPVEVYPADWSQYGKAAGMIRNQQMIDEGKPDMVVGFHDDLHLSKGTKGMLRIAKKAGIPTYHVEYGNVIKL